MADHNLPTNTTLYSLVLQYLRDLISDVAKMYDGTTTSNIPVGAKGYNSTNNKFQQWNGTAWVNLGFHTAIDNHINDPLLHASVPIGASIDYHGTVAPTGFLLEDGSAVSRTTYASLFTVLGTTHGSGDGSTTFNLPDSRGRSYVARTAGGVTSTMGYKFGSLDHTHSTPAHQHTVPSHNHGLANHTHSVAAHTHLQAAHLHIVYGHFHDTLGSGATIAVSNPSGDHNHQMQTRIGGSASIDSSAGGDFVLGANEGAGTQDNKLTRVDTTPRHVHNHSDFSGTVGNASGGISGDVNQWTDAGTSGAVSTGSGGGGNTGSPSVGFTDLTIAFSTSGLEGGGTTGTANHACIVATRIIKY